MIVTLLSISFSVVFFVIFFVVFSVFAYYRFSSYLIKCEGIEGKYIYISGINRINRINRRIII